MFIFCIVIFFTTLAGLAAQVYTALTLQAQTVAYTIQAIKHEEYTRGTLAYGITLLGDSDLMQRIATEKKVIIMDNTWNTQEDGFLCATITYSANGNRYGVEISLFEQQRFLSGIRAYIKGKKCVAIETF